MSEKKSALSDAALRKLKPTGKRYEVTDSVAIGLRARVSAEGKVAFILKSRNAANKLKTITIGAYPEMSLKEAREEASLSRLQLKAGKDVNEEKRLVRQAAAQPTTGISLRELIGEFEARFASAKKIWQPRGPRSDRSSARQVIERVFAKLLDRDVTDTSDEDFAHTALGYKRVRLDLSRFRSGLLRAILAIKETGYGSDTQRRVQAGCGSHRANQWPDTASGCV